MFTGLVEEIGIVLNRSKTSKKSVLKIGCNKILEDISLGDSIAVNGVCLTVTNYSTGYFEADVMNETISKTNLNFLKIGNSVNLERALKLGDRLGGHIVSGHIDGLGIVKDFQNDGNSVWITIKVDKEILKYIVYKGSVALDGISLTVAYVDEKQFKVSIVTHTQGETTLLKKKIGAPVNVECDQIGKYIERFLNYQNNSSKDESSININTLKKYGYI